MAMETIANAQNVAKPTAGPEDPVSSIGIRAKELFEDHQASRTEALQNELDALTVKVASTAFELFREQTDELLRVLRNAYGQVARFVEGDFREDPSFYLGQLHALSELAHRVGHQRVTKEAMEPAARSAVVRRILRTVVEEQSIGAAELASVLAMEESNLSATCKPLVERDLLRRDKFGRRVRYSPTPMTHAVVAQLGSHTPTRQVEDESAKAVNIAAAAAPSGGTPDWARMTVAAAANSLEPGHHVMANTDDFLSPLLTLAGVRGSEGIAIDPSGRQVRLEGKAKEEKRAFQLPISVGQSLAEQLRAYLDPQQITSPIIVGDWKGQKLLLAREDAGEGTGFKVRFLNGPDPDESKSKMKTAFHEIQAEKTRLRDFEKIYVREVLDSCHGIPSKAASTLGIKSRRLKTLIKDLQIEL